MIEVSHLTKKYGSRLAVDDISFTVEDGVIYGLLGPNGAGKSTIMNILTGYLAATEGQVTVAGHPLPEEADAAKACVGYLPEQPPLYPEMTVAEYLDFAAELKGVKKADRPGRQPLRRERRAFFRRARRRRALRRHAGRTAARQGARLHRRQRGGTRCPRAGDSRRRCGDDRADKASPPPRFAQPVRLDDIFARSFRGLPVYCHPAPEWRNGRRGGLKNRCLRRAGSNPASGTTSQMNELQKPCVSGARFASRP